MNASITKTYNLQITVTDKGNPALSATAIITINVVSVSKPVFENTPYKFCVKENEESGKVVFTVKATDSNGDQLSYSLSPSTTPFSINPTTGVIRSKACFDREKTDSYIFKVHVSDGTFTVVAEINVCIKDKNDNKPIISKPNAGIICENAAQGKQIINIIATDPDLSTVLEYSLASDYTPLPFIIDNKGQIKLSGNIDFETKTSYKFTVLVSDGVHKSNVKAEISICNINQHNPIFNPVNYTNTITNKSPKNTNIVTVVATDEDDGKAGVIRYSIISGNPNKMFIINQVTGKIIWNKRVKITTTTTYKLVVRATDRGEPPRSSNPDANVYITIKVKGKYNNRGRNKV